MNSINTAFIKLSFFSTAGILAGFFSGIKLSFLVFIFSGVFVLFLITFFREKKLFLQDIYFGTATLLLFFLIGILTTKLHLPENQPQHYSNFFTSEANSEDPPLLMVSISEELKADLYNRKFIAEVEQINKKSAHGKLLLLIRKDSTAAAIDIDDRLLVWSKLQPIPAPLNPYQFNYRNFMKNRGVLNQAYLASGNFEILNSNSSSIKGWAANRRAGIVKKLEKNNFKKEELGIIQALLLGQRQDISEEIYYNYTAAGVIHVLAVSGLHVGIILLLLHRLFAPLERFKNGKVLKILLLIILLWIFAVLAGLSPSVVRAVTMFSFVAIGLQIKRRTSVLNTLFMSMMLLLLIKPQFIFEIGFQLSYLAVFSIVLLQPPLYALLKPYNRATKYLWGLLTVTIAAQAGVLPLSLYYFHQFPALFFISNLVILPFMGIILFIGIVVIALALLNYLPSFITEIYSLLISSLNDFVGFMAGQKNFLFQDISFSGYQAFAFYLLLAAIFLLFKKISFPRIITALSAVLILQMMFYIQSYQTSSEELVIFHKSRNTLIGKKTGHSFTLNHNLQETPEKQSLIRNYLVGENIKSSQYGGLQDVYGFGKNVLLVIDSSVIYSVENLQPEYILLINSPKINLNRLLGNLRPKAVIADGSNYRSYLDRWRATCGKENIPFHSTARNGAFIVKH